MLFFPLDRAQVQVLRVVGMGGLRVYGATTAIKIGYMVGFRLLFALLYNCAAVFVFCAFVPLVPGAPLWRHFDLNRKIHHATQGRQGTHGQDPQCAPLFIKGDVLKVEVGDQSVLESDLYVERNGRRPDSWRAGCAGS